MTIVTRGKIIYTIVKQSILLLRGKINKLCHKQLLNLGNHSWNEQNLEINVYKKSEYCGFKANKCSYKKTSY